MRFLAMNLQWMAASGASARHCKEAGMDPNPFVNPPLAYILFGLVAVLLLAAVVYAVGAWGAGKMREGRLQDSTDIPYPEQPRSDDDRETVARARSTKDSSDRITSDEQLDDLAVGADRKIVPQTPTRGERPVDAAERSKSAHQIGAQDQGEASPAADEESGTRSPL
jgi:hypothetical protein